MRSLHAESVTIGPGTNAPVVVPRTPRKPGPLMPVALYPHATSWHLMLWRRQRWLMAYRALWICPQEIKTVTIEQWREKMFEISVITREHSNPTVAFGRICERLSSKSLVGIRGNLIWAVTGS